MFKLSLQSLQATGHYYRHAFTNKNFFIYRQVKRYCSHRSLIQKSRPMCKSVFIDHVIFCGAFLNKLTSSLKFTSLNYHKTFWMLFFVENNSRSYTSAFWKLFRVMFFPQIQTKYLHFSKKERTSVQDVTEVIIPWQFFHFKTKLRSLFSKMLRIYIGFKPSYLRNRTLIFILNYMLNFLRLWRKLQRDSSRCTQM